MDRIEEISREIMELRDDLHDEIRYRVDEALSGYVSEDADVDKIIDRIVELSIERDYWIKKKAG